MTCCSRTITGNTGIAHCGACCQTFSGIGGFDMHRRGGSCADPATIVGEKTGEALLRLDDRGIWVGAKARPAYWKTEEAA